IPDDTKFTLKEATFRINSAWNDIKPSSILKSWEPILGPRELLPDFEIKIDDIVFENRSTYCCGVATNDEFEDCDYLTFGNNKGIFVLFFTKDKNKDFITFLNENGTGFIIESTDVLEYRSFNQSKLTLNVTSHIDTTFEINNIFDILRISTRTKFIRDVIMITILVLEAMTAQPRANFTSENFNDELISLCHNSNNVITFNVNQEIVVLTKLDKDKIKKLVKAFIPIRFMNDLSNNDNKLENSMAKFRVLLDYGHFIIASQKAINVFSNEHLESTLLLKPTIPGLSKITTFLISKAKTRGKKNWYYYWPIQRCS
ncbi:hypothetical protein A3Q56_00648, partial [Intoshia linei]